jgi:D-glycerate 3-kinase
MADRNNQTVPHIAELIRQQQLPESFTSVVKTIYKPLAEHLIDAKIPGEPLFVSINGAQGSGKSTLTLFLKQLLEDIYDQDTVATSIDDFYLTRAERQTLAKTVHPLLQTRGVPGTHDIRLMEKVFNQLLSGYATALPVFDKGQDDRKPNLAEHRPADIILFEGWCNNSLPQDEEELRNPVNELELNEDPDGSWRNYVNEQVGEYQKRIFNKVHLSIMLKAPAFEKVYDWRKKQEDKLAEKNAGTDNRVMSADELKRFIQHYERLTRHNLSALPSQVDILLPLDEEQKISQIIVKKDSG